MGGWPFLVLFVVIRSSYGLCLKLSALVHRSDENFANEKLIEAVFSELSEILHHHIHGFHNYNVICK